MNNLYLGKHGNFMKTIYIIIFCIISSIGMCLAQTPPQASNEGYNRLTLDSGFGNIDLLNTQAPGYSWYIANWFGASTSDPANFSVHDGALTVGGVNLEANSILNSALKSGDTYVGKVFGGGGYFEVEFSTNTQDSVFAGGYPNLFLEPIEHILQNGSDQWPGQVSGFAHFGELDIVELYHTPNGDFTGSTQYNSGVHDWSGVWDSGFPVNIANFGTNWITPPDQPVNWGARNKYGLLWVTQKGSTPGYISYYFNGRLAYTLYYLGPVTAPPLPGYDNHSAGASVGSYSPITPAMASQTYSIIDGEHFAIRFGSDPAWPMTVYSIKVWQR